MAKAKLVITKRVSIVGYLWTWCLPGVRSFGGLLFGLWLEDTDQVGLHVVAGHGVGPCAAPSAHLIEGADAALPLEEGRVSELLEERGLAVGLHQVFTAHVARGDGEEAAGLDFAYMGDEADPFAVVGGGHTHTVSTRPGRCLIGGGLALHHDAAVGLSQGGSYADG